MGDDGSAGEEALLYQPADVVVDADGRVFVFDAGDSRIAAYNAEGVFLGGFGQAGEGPGEFGTANRSDRLVSDGEHLYTLSGVSKEVQRWTTSGEYEDRFILERPLPLDVAVAGGSLYFSVFSRRDGQISVVRTTPEGAINGEWTSTSLYEGNTRWVTQLNFADLAVATDGEILTSFRAWPLLWSVPDLAAHGHGHHWLDFSWLPDREPRERLARPEALLDDRDLELPGHEEMRWVAGWEVEYVPGPDLWFLLSSQNVLTAFGRDLRPLGAVRLTGEGGEQAEVIRFGVSPDGGRVCVTDPMVTLVRCYDLSEFLLSVATN